MALATIDRITNQMGAEFVAWLQANAPVGAIPQAITWADSKVLGYLQKRATAAMLEQNDWALLAATTLACWKLSGHGGEPHNATTKEEMEDVMRDLQLMFQMKMDIPGLEYDASNDVNKGAGPVLSIQQVDLQRFPQTRRIPQISTGRPAGYPVANTFITARRPG